jgi:outer membrane autotransporter protein
MWLKPFGSSATQSENDGIGFESKSSGIVIGADALYTPDTRLGVALVMSKGDVETESLAAQEADVDTQQVVFYGNTALDDRTDVSYYLGFGMSDVEGRRTGSLLTGTLRSSFDSKSVFAGFDLGRTFQISEKASFRPSIRADYVSVKDDAYTETGASNMALSVRSQTTDSLVVGIDGKFSYAISDATKFTARLGIGADTIDDRAQATASFARFAGSPSFLTEGAKSSSFLVNGGLGLVGRVSSNLEMSANLDFESGSDFKAQSFSVKARWSF